MFLGEIFVWEGYITILFLEEGEYVVVVIWEDEGRKEGGAGRDVCFWGGIGFIIW
jgi:hypothetical protein